MENIISIAKMIIETVKDPSDLYSSLKKVNYTITENDENKILQDWVEGVLIGVHQHARYSK